jgi:hypothetical protein
VSATFDKLFGIDPERQAMNAGMNQMMVAHLNAGVNVGTMAARASAQPSLSEVMHERLSAALTELERAERGKDPDAVAYANHLVDRLTEEARAARTEQPRNPDGTFAPPPEFDGGVRRTRDSERRHTHQQESATSLMARAMMTSRQERTERGEEQTLIASNV